MGHRIEVAKTGRATCRTCRQGIEKGTLRFGEETFNAFSDSGGTTFLWHHLKCAAQKKPHELKAAMSTFEEEIPNRDEIEAIVREAESKVKPPFPYAEKSPSNRSKCISCGEVIEKGALRIAVEQEVQTAGFTAKAARYLHPACAKSFTNDEALKEQVKAHSRDLDADEIALLDRSL